MFAFGLAGLVLTVKVFRGIVTGEMGILAWQFKREGRERAFWIWMAVWALTSLALFFAALKCYLGPVSF